MRQLALASVFCLVVPSLVLANITVGSDPTITSTGSVFTWSYDVTLGGGETATSIVSGGSCVGSTAPACGGTFFTIYDVSDYVSGSASAPVGWGVSIQLVGLTPTGQTPDTADSASLENLTFFYTGAQITGPQDLGIFSLQSTSGTEVFGSYTEQSNSNPPGFREHGGGLLFVPGSVAPVPEAPSYSLALIGAGLIGLAISHKRFARRVQQS